MSNYLLVPTNKGVGSLSAINCSHSFHVQKGILGFQTLNFSGNRFEAHQVWKCNAVVCCRAKFYFFLWTLLASEWQHASRQNRMSLIAAALPLLERKKPIFAKSWWKHHVKHNWQLDTLQQNTQVCFLDVWNRSCSWCQRQHEWKKWTASPPPAPGFLKTI